MTVIRYVALILLVATHLQPAAIRSMCGKIHQDISIIERLVGVATDRHTTLRTCGHTDKASSTAQLILIKNILYIPERVGAALSTAVKY